MDIHLIREVIEYDIGQDCEFITLEWIADKDNRQYLITIIKNNIAKYRKRLDAEPYNPTLLRDIVDDYEILDMLA